MTLDEHQKEVMICLLAAKFHAEKMLKLCPGVTALVVKPIIGDINSIQQSLYALKDAMDADDSV